MFKLDKVLGLLKKATPSAAELEAAIVAIDVAALEAAVEDLEVQRQKLLLADDAESELENIELRIREANRSVERASLAREELGKKRSIALEREAVAAVERTAADAREARARLIENLAAVDGLAAEVAEKLAMIVADRATIRQANQTTANASRSDLKTGDPLGELALLLGFDNADRISNPVEWRLGPYWPRLDASLHPVGNTRHLARIRELLAAPARKAA